MKRLAPLPIVLTLAACTAPSDPQPAPPPLVRAWRVAPAAGDRLELRGQVAAKSRVRLGFKQAGVVDAVLVREGDRVAAGQVVARLDDVDARAMIRMARTARDKARRDAERATRLAREGALATSLSDDAQSQLEAAEAQFLQAEDAMNRTRLAAPVSGTVFMRTAEPGETVGAGSPIVVLDSTGALEIEAGATLREARLLRTGLAVSLVPEEGGERDAAPGHVRSIATTPNPGDGLYAVSLVPDRPPSAWRPGALFRARAFTPRGSTGLRIPLEALVHRQEQDYVFVVRAGAGSPTPTVQIRPVVLGPAEAREIQIVSGLAPGEEIVAEGSYFLQDGQAVRILR